MGVPIPLSSALRFLPRMLPDLGHCNLKFNLGAGRLENIQRKIMTTNLENVTYKMVSERTGLNSTKREIIEDTSLSM